MVIETTFPSSDAMERLVAMGMEEGMSLALGQIDDLGTAIERRDPSVLAAEEAAERLTDAAGGARDRDGFACKLPAHVALPNASRIQARFARRR